MVYPDRVPQQKDCLDVPYRRYRHRESGYVVEVLSVEAHSGQAVTFKTVRVKGTLLNPERETSWNLESFLQLFAPVGRKLRRKTAWDHLDDPLV